MNLWGQVITLRGQIWGSRIGDDTLRVLCCVLCDVCVVVQCVGVGVCFGMVLVLVRHVDPSLPPPPVPHTPLFRVHIPVCVRGPRPASVTHMRAGTHGPF